MGFAAGTQLTLDNALKMMMVRSANDVAVTIAEGISGSVEKFADEMNSAARRLGMVQSSFVNPNGLPADNQISSARDLGILARALIRDFPQYGFYWHIPAIRFGKRVTRNYNRLISRYPGADGMKTGYICASGFNLVATATRNGKQLIAVVLGAPSSTLRAEKAAKLLERGFNGNGLAWLRPSLGTVDGLVPIAAAPLNMREEMCVNRKKPASETDEDDDAETGVDAEGADGNGTGNGRRRSLLSSLLPLPKDFSLAAFPVLPVEPIEVFVGPPKQSARVASGATPGAKPIAVTPVQTAAAGRPGEVKAGSAPAVWTSLTATPAGACGAARHVDGAVGNAGHRAAAPPAACRPEAAGAVKRPPAVPQASRGCQPPALCRIFPNLRAPHRAAIRSTKEARWSASGSRIIRQAFPPTSIRRAGRLSLR